MGPQSGHDVDCVLRYVRNNTVPINNNTIVEYIVADVGNGEKHKKKVYPLAGEVVEYNLYGNNVR